MDTPSNKSDCTIQPYYSGGAYIMRADGSVLRGMDAQISQQLAARHNVNQARMSAATNDSVTTVMNMLTIKVRNEEGKEVQIEADLNNPEHTELVRTQHRVRTQTYSPANDPSVDPSTYVFPDVHVWRDDNLLMEYQGRFPPVRSNRHKEWLKIGAREVAHTMQMFPPFLVRTPFFAMFLVASGTPMHIVSNKLIALSNLYLLTLISGYGPPTMEDREAWNNSKEIRAPFQPGPEKMFVAIKELEAVISKVKTGTTDNANESARSSGFYKLAKICLWLWVHRMNDYMFAVAAVPNRQTPSWFTETWRRCMPTLPPPIIPEALTDVMLEAPLTHAVMLYHHKVRKEIDDKMFDRLEKEEMAACYDAATEVMKLFEKTIWDVLSMARNPEFPHGHIMYDPYNHMRCARGFDMDLDYKTRLMCMHDGDWLHFEAGLELRTYVDVMGTVLRENGFDFSSPAVPENLSYRPTEEFMVAHARMIASDQEDEKIADIEDRFTALLDEAMREKKNRAQFDQVEKVIRPKVVRVDAAADPTATQRMRAVALPGEKECAVCKNTMAEEYDDVMGMMVFCEASVRFDGSVACVKCH